LLIGIQNKGGIMALTVKKKSSYIFSPPSYIKKGGTLDNKVEEIINDVIKEKIFNLLDINRSIYIRKVEYFPIFSTCKETGNKSIKSFMMRAKNKQGKFRKINSREIELSGVSVSEFVSFLKKNSAKEVFNYEKQLQNL